MEVNLLYAHGHDLHDPYVSPLFADVSGFPRPSSNWGHATSSSSAVRMHRKLRAGPENSFIAGVGHFVDGGAVRSDQPGDGTDPPAADLACRQSEITPEQERAQGEITESRFAGHHDAQLRGRNRQRPADGRAGAPLLLCGAVTAG